MKQRYIDACKKFSATPISDTRAIRKCNCCQVVYEVKIADLARGWGLSCSKSCAATRQTGKMKKWLSVTHSKDYVTDDYDEGWDGHKNY